ncbi:hypothetical protein AS030_18930 [Fictibacillus enclensis]|uniref:Uncharacterized protein n=1 Tax=Fictibacillus enclensis TaxID=1017270 RepID=A0A0V8J1R5_9BACL|nr:hypothetical protein AS030_18930 [Fictibacillus enclensis]
MYVKLAKHSLSSGKSGTDETKEALAPVREALAPITLSPRQSEHHGTEIDDSHEPPLKTQKHPSFF